VIVKVRRSSVYTTINVNIYILYQYDMYIYKGAYVMSIDLAISM
jgi:hypothetical protein